MKKNTGIRSRTKYLKVSNGILFIFFIHSIYKRWKGKMESISTTCKFLLQISQNHSLNRVCPSSKVSHCSSVTRIRNPRRLFIAKVKFLRGFMRRVLFSTEDKYFLPFEEPRIRGVTVLRCASSYRNVHFDTDNCVYNLLVFIKCRGIHIV